MRRIAATLSVIILIAIAITSWPRVSSAHPHAWIDLRTTVHFDENGHVVAIEQHWFFDPIYSLYATEGLDIGSEVSKEALTTLAKDNLESLREFDYFTEVRLGDEKMEIGTVEEFESTMRDDRLWMRFVLPLAKPLDPAKGTISYAIFDPTYYVEMLHVEDDVVALTGSKSETCTATIESPNPTSDAVMLAQSLDRDETPDTPIGALFAETVLVRCEG